MFKKISQNVVKSPLKFTPYLTDLVHILWHVWKMEACLEIRGFSKAVLEMLGWKHAVLPKMVVWVIGWWQGPAVVAAGVGRVAC